MSSISTHVLDLVHGGPAAGVPVVLERLDGEWHALFDGVTDHDGRVPALRVYKAPRCAYRITFDTDAWFAAAHLHGFYPVVQVVFVVPPGDAHHHVPLLLGPYGYSTYRGS
ncbi:MAG: hydroxyisourate hydrolase [Myxococcota bacterium]